MDALMVSDAKQGESLPLINLDLHIALIEEKPIASEHLFDASLAHRSENIIYRWIDLAFSNKNLMSKTFADNEMLLFTIVLHFAMVKT